MDPLEENISDSGCHSWIFLVLGSVIVMIVDYMYSAVQ